MTLWEVAAELSRRLTRIFLRDDDGRAPGVTERHEMFQHDPHWQRSGPVLRVLPRRRRPRRRRQPSDRLDGPGRQAAAAERRARRDGSTAEEQRVLAVAERRTESVKKEMHDESASLSIPGTAQVSVHLAELQKPSVRRRPQRTRRARQRAASRRRWHRQGDQRRRVRRRAWATTFW